MNCLILISIVAIVLERKINCVGELQVNTKPSNRFWKMYVKKTYKRCSCIIVEEQVFQKATF